MTQERHEVILLELDYDGAPIQLSTVLLTNLTRRLEQPVFMEHVVIKEGYAADCITHAVRDADVTEKSCSVIMRGSAQADVANASNLALLSA
jgi:hypothetical protein